MYSFTYLYFSYVLNVSYPNFYLYDQSTDLDYKRLIDPSENPLDVIRPVLNSSNINQIAKLASKIPCGDGSFLQPSLVYCAWALKQFWEGSTSKKGASSAGVPQSHSDWVHR